MDEVLKAVVDEFTEAACLLDISGRFVHVNSAAEQLLRTTDEQARGLHFSEFFGDSVDLDECLAAADGPPDGDPVHSFETPCRVKDGPAVQVSCSVRRLATGGIEPATLIVVRDALARFNSSALELDYRHLVESANSIILALDLEGRVTFVNRFAEEFFGYKAHDLLGQPVAGTILPDAESSGRDLRGLFASVLENPEEYQTNENENITLDGRRVWVTWTNKVILAPNGTPVGVISVGQDITARKTAEETLRNAHGELELRVAERTRELVRVNEELRRTAVEKATILHALTELVVFHDQDMRVRWTNRAAREYFGIDATELVGARCHEIWRQREDACPGCPVRAALSEGQPREGEMRTSDGRIWLIRAHPVFENNEVVGVVETALDITARRRAADAQRLAAVGQLAAGVAHEFNNLLASMLLGAEVALTRTDEEEAVRLAELVQRAAKRGGEVCRNLTSFARPRDPRMEPVCIDDAMNAALAVASPQLASSQVIVRRSLNAQDVPVLGDASQIEQVFLNMIINACQAMPRGGELTISSRIASVEGGREVIASFSDTGVGISPSNLPRLFEPFFTTKGAIGQGDIPGTGLGLSVSHSVITAHGGSIAVNSELGVGSTFEVHLKADLSASSSDTETAADPNGREAGWRPSSRVLLAEDDEDLRELILETLADHGHSVTPVGSADEAVEALSLAAYDLVVTDLLMPGGGAAVLEAVSEMDRPVPALVVTGKAGNALPAEYYRLPTKDCLRKPFTISELSAAIAGLTASP